MKNLHADIDNVIPAFPAIIIEINRVIDLPETNYKKLSSIIEKDPAICTKILKIVNSAFYGMPSEVSNIPDAVSIIGFDVVHRIALTISVLKTLKDGTAGSDFNEINLWRHLFYTASISRYISSTFKISNPSDAYIAALLHDIGKFILFKIAPLHYLKIREAAIKNRTHFHKAEKKFEGYPNHGDLGAYAAKKWKFPAKLIDSIKYHHSFSSKAASKDDLLLLMVSNYIENYKETILNSGIDMKNLNPMVNKMLGEPLRDINLWLPSVLNKAKIEFQTFAESI